MNMQWIKACAGLVLSLAINLSDAEDYRWVDPDDKVHFSYHKPMGQSGKGVENRHSQMQEVIGDLLPPGNSL